MAQTGTIPLPLRPTHLGALLREERVRKGITQQHVADAFGIDVASIKQLESGVRPLWGRVREYLQVLGVENDDEWIASAQGRLERALNRISGGDPLVRLAATEAGIRKVRSAARRGSSVGRALVLPGRWLSVQAGNLPPAA